MNFFEVEVAVGQQEVYKQFPLALIPDLRFLAEMPSQVSKYLNFQLFWNVFVLLS